MKLEFSRQIFEKNLNIKFNENPSIFVSLKVFLRGSVRKYNSLVKEFVPVVI